LHAVLEGKVDAFQAIKLPLKYHSSFLIENMEFAIHKLWFKPGKREIIIRVKQHPFLNPEFVQIDNEKTVILEDIQPFADSIHT
jgi:hypothetical protein